jgi:hypothetical protein
MAPKQATAWQRGYGELHKLERKKWSRLVDAGQACCVRCGGFVAPGTRWDLDHTDDRTGYLGVSHSTCNRSAAASSGNRVRAAKARGEIAPDAKVVDVPNRDPERKTGWGSPEGRRWSRDWVAALTTSTAFRCARSGRCDPRLSPCNRGRAPLAHALPRSHRSLGDLK